MDKEKELDCEKEIVKLEAFLQGEYSAEECKKGESAVDMAIRLLRERKTWIRIK